MRYSAFLLVLILAACAESGPNEAIGDLHVITVTTGTPDPDGYSVTVGIFAARTVAANDTTEFGDLPIEDYTVTLGDVEGGCVVSGTTSREVYVPIGVTEVEFLVNCP